MSFYTSLVRGRSALTTTSSSHRYYVRFSGSDEFLGSIESGKMRRGCYNDARSRRENARMGSKGKGGRPRSVHSRAHIIYNVEGMQNSAARPWRTPGSSEKSSPSSRRIRRARSSSFPPPASAIEDDHKLTDLLYLCHAHKKYGVSCDPAFDMIAATAIGEILRASLGFHRVDIDSELCRAARARYEAGISKDELVSRGEYFSAQLMADYLGYDFLDAAPWLHFSL